MTVQPPPVPVGHCIFSFFKLHKLPFCFYPLVCIVSSSIQSVLWQEGLGRVSTAFQPTAALQNCVIPVSDDLQHAKARVLIDEVHFFIMLYSSCHICSQTRLLVLSGRDFQCRVNAAVLCWCILVLRALHPCTPSWKHPPAAIAKA